MRREVFVLGLGIAAACSSSPVVVNQHPDGGGGSSSTSASTSTSTSSSSSASSSGWYPMGDGGTSTLPVIPSSCVPSSAYVDLGPNGTLYACPTAVPENCAPQPQPQGYVGPDLYWCPNSICAPGCADLPCPPDACPSTATAVYTCGPGMPDVESGCTLIATADAGPVLAGDGGASLGGRYTYCCLGPGQDAGP
jgi:hypothetical protein